METINLNGKKFTYSFTNKNGDFIWDWSEYCDVEPYTEEVYEDEMGSEYILYRNDKGESLGSFLNND